MNPVAGGYDAHDLPSRGSRSLALLGLTTFALAGGLLGPLSSASYRMAAASAFGLLVGDLFLADLGGRSGRMSRLPTVLLVFLAGALLIVHAPAPEGPIVAATLAVMAAMALAGRMSVPEAAALEPVIAGGAVLSVYTLLTNRFPVLWVLVEGATRDVTSALGRVGRSGTSLGPSVAGVGILALVLGYVGARLLGARRGERATAVLALLWIVLLAAIGWSLGVPLLLRAFNAALVFTAVAPPGEMPVPGYPASVAVFLPLALYVAWLLPTLVLGAGGIPAARARRRVPGAVTAASLFSAGALLSLIAAWPGPSFKRGDRPPRVLFSEHGKLSSWDVPTVGTEGLERSGMFGLLPHYLKVCGFESRRLDDVLSPEALGWADAVVVINPTEGVPAEARARLEKFVSGGGGLVVLGDHTDILGSRGPLNELLEPYGVSFRFDSAFTPGHWHNDSGFFPGRLTRRLDDANNRFQQSTGASLVLSRNTVPVATARWGFSDAGDHSNEDNAFLGDYIYQANETLGDLPVVALARHGRGRVIVFGDTSTFQNIAIPYSWEFVVGVFQAATARGRGVPPSLTVFALGVWTLLLIGVLAWLPALDWAWLLAGTLAGLVVAQGIGGTVPILRNEGRPLALVDVAHFNAVSLDIWDAKALTALNVNLARNGYLAIVDREGHRPWLEAADLFVTVAPRKEFSRAEVDRLRAFTERGGRLVLAVGWEEKRASKALLAMAGLDLSAVPLGPVPILRKISDDEIYRRLQMEPHFAAAWPVEGSAPERDEILYAAGDYPIVVRRRLGQGSFTLLGDSRFLLNRTLEEEGTSWQGNVAFLRRIFEAPAMTSPQAVR